MWGFRMNRRLFSITTALFVTAAALSITLFLGASYRVAETAISPASDPGRMGYVPLDDMERDVSPVSQAVSTVETTGWVIECIDCPESIPSVAPPDTPSQGEISFKRDSAGELHVLHPNNNDELEYVYQEGDAWHTVVLTTDMG